MPAQKLNPTHFATIQTLHLDYAPVSITQYESKRTGMRVVVVDQPGPKVNGYFALATEIHDDSGAPHTLEHLCFMGSKSYQYKGLLDKLATRAYSTTNAWTATEQTAYTLETAGWAGFAQILPVYLEHVIVPTLTDAGCYTEVHHIDGSGHDAGVVYSEMQGVQNSQSELMELRAKRLMYPEGCGFRYETGGMMEALRILTADRIRDFHREMYQPKNLCLVLTGAVDHQEMLQILDGFEDTILGDVPAFDAPFARPWVDSKPIPDLAHTIVETVDFPEEDESMGEVMVGFHGPPGNDHLAVAALSILLIYLCGSSISVLENTLVEKEQLCSMIYYNVEYRPKVGLWFSLTAVETEHLQKANDRLISLLKETAGKPLDMNYMHDCINRWRRQIKMKCENAGDFFATPIIDDHLFGRRDGRDLKEMETIKELDDLEHWNDQQWRDFLSKWMANAHHVSILGVPSKELSDKMTNDEKARVKAQQERLGEDGMKKLAEKLKKAQDENDRPIPDSLLEQFPVPSADSVQFISTTTARAGLAKKMGSLENPIQHIIDKDDHDTPLFIHFEHIPSSFVRVQVNLCTGSLPAELKPLLLLYLTNFFTTPVRRHGKRIEFEDVVLDLEKETVEYAINYDGTNSEMIALTAQTEPENYEKVISWFQTLLYDAIHDPVRLLASLTKILADIPDEKRSGDAMAMAVNTMIQYKQESSVRAGSTLAKGPYLKRVKKLLQRDAEPLLAQMTQLCETLHRPANFRIYVSANIESLQDPVSAWRRLTTGFDTSKPLEPLDNRRALLSTTGANPGSAAYIIPMATIDSSFATFTTQGPTSYDDPDVPALLVARAYLDAVEGPLWVAVRGTGLAYGTGFYRSLETGLVHFRISRSPDAYKAFAAAKKQVEGFATGAQPFDKFALEGAVSEIVLGMAEEQPTMASAAQLSYSNQVIRGISKDWSHAMLKRVQAVTPDQLRAVMAKYMLPAFEPKSANLVITCAQIMGEKMCQDFEKAGFAPEVKTLESFEDRYGAHATAADAGLGEDADDDKDDDDEDEDEDESNSEEDEDDEVDGMDES